MEKLVFLLLASIVIISCDSKDYSYNKPQITKQESGVSKINQDSLRKTFTYLKNIFNDKLKPINIDSVNKLEFTNKFNKEVRTKAGIKNIVLEYFHYYQNPIPGRKDTLKVVQANCKIFNYNKQGLLTQKWIAYKTDTAINIEYLYDSNDNLIKVLETNLVDKTSSEYYFIYDEKWNLLRKSSIYSGNYLTLYNYDSLGRISEELMVKEDILNGKKKYSYLKNSLLESSILIKAPDVNSLITYQYNNKNQLSNMSVNSTFTNRKDSSLFVYNKKGDLIEKKYTTSKGNNITKFKYSYDNNDNWIKKIEYVNGKIFNEITRDIQYY